MQSQIKIEELFMLLLSFWLFSKTGYSWWWFIGLFFAPDISFLAYLAGPKTGAFVYNLLHSKAVALALVGAGLFSGVSFSTMIGSIMFGHSSFDRIFGYGLKFPDSFHHTHLGFIGKKSLSK
ncbi:MAG: DUF4260 domain-containing protein [Owenweeksia sp.]|nr:DUF4260 domain-containing protein [Owenweeksia sp.]